MEINEAREAKNLLEREVLKLIQNFEKATNLKVRDVLYDETPHRDNAGTINVRSLKIKVEI